MNNLSIITAHFYDFDWIELWITQIRKFTNPDIVKEILIVNQDRTETSRNRLQKIDKQARILEFPKSDKHFKVTGHDHAAVLNSCIKEASGEFICILDSDAHPIRANWIIECQQLLNYYDAILAQHPGLPGISHPCFMLINREHVNIPLTFDDQLFSSHIDTGRLIGKQLINAGHKVYFASPKKAFNGYWGYIYLDLIYHHQNASFFGGDDRLKKQVSWHNRYFRNLVVNKRTYSLTLTQLYRYRLLLFTNYCSKNFKLFFKRLLDINI